MSRDWKYRLWDGSDNILTVDNVCASAEMSRDNSKIVYVDVGKHGGSVIHTYDVNSKYDCIKETFDESEMRHLSVDFTDNPSVIIIHSWLDGKIIIYNIETCEKLAQINLNPSSKTIEFSRDRKYAIVSSGKLQEPGTVTCYKLEY